MASQLVVRACPPFRVPGQDSARAAAELERDARQFLDPPELQRARAMMAVPRQDFLAARMAQRLLAAELLGVRVQDLTARYSCPQCGSGPAITHGRPGYMLDGAPAPLLLSLSRAKGWTLLAAMTEPGPEQQLGVDVEDPQRLDFDGFDAVALTTAERQAVASLYGDDLLRGRARLWARKEAFLKMTGEGLSRAPETVDVLERPGVRDLAPADSGLPVDLVAAVAVG
ncbi:4'-phosphopantetheinyl transferase superfamily protein [Arthrobacter sp. ISL-69]|uniref:4'-phosphopantetheinyl transferase family protein n=1 Tax=Arthrobacter sp. ISL-69 TaxID=2819113 RepID=UPI001BE97E5A|nr:4'-phosphopantetheinyl transferase superfamily protein [Arthrobacter sp. ISL-69]MBT2536699.1 4'-phosphopantetheinyl transferase superfamily protein [Arthrobacter sp. ISL-69]